MIRELLDHVVSLRSSAKWLLLSTLVGIVAGCGGIVFQVTEQAIFRVASQGVAGFSPKEAEGERRLYSDPGVPMSPARLLLVLAAGAPRRACSCSRSRPEAGGHGTDAAIEAYHHKRGYIRPIVPIVKLLASAITIGTGGSGGREGPIAQIGAGFGSSLGAWLKLSVRDRRILLAAGMGAGIGAIFRAPLAGALVRRRNPVSRCRPGDRGDRAGRRLLDRRLHGVFVLAAAAHAFPAAVRRQPAPPTRFAAGAGCR